MALIQVTRTIIRSNSVSNIYDLVLSTSKAGNKKRDSFTLSDALFASTGLSGKDKAAIILQDDETKKVYFAVVPAEAGEVLKARAVKEGGKETVKSPEFQHRDAIAIFEATGAVSTEREIGYNAAFNLVPSEVELDGATAIFEIQPTEFVKGESKPTTAPKADVAVNVTPSAPSETSASAPVIDTAAAATDDWE